MSNLLLYETEPISFREGRMAFPEAKDAVRALREHVGETFADFNTNRLAVGTIADDKEPLTFYKSSYGKDDPVPTINASIKTHGGTKYHLSWSGIIGGWPVETGMTEHFDATYDAVLGHLGGEYSLPQRAPRLHTSERISDAQALDRLRSTLVVGNRACGAFGIGKALKEMEEDKYPKHSTMYTSTGLGLVALLKEGGVDWRPVSGRGAVAFDEAVEALRGRFVEGTLVPLVLKRIAMQGTFARADYVGNRAPVFDFDHVSLRDELVTRVLNAGQTDEHIARALAWGRTETEPRGNYEDYLRDCIASMLSNQLGIKPVIDVPQPV